jgi:ketosteroid isomerase-like protein
MEDIVALRAVVRYLEDEYKRGHRGGPFMQTGSNKVVVSRYFLQGLGEPNPDVVDEIFAPDHVLNSPEFGMDAVEGTQVIKDAIEGLRRDAVGVSCTIENQIEEGDWVATSYTISEEQNDHMGIMISRVQDGKIAESHVVAKTVTVAEAGQRTDRIETARRAFN